MKLTGSWTEMGEQLRQRDLSSDDWFEHVDDGLGALFIGETIRVGLDARSGGVVRNGTCAAILTASRHLDALIDQSPGGLVADAFVFRASSGGAGRRRPRCRTGRRPVAARLAGPHPIPGDSGDHWRTVSAEPLDHLGHGLPAVAGARASTARMRAFSGGGFRGLLMVTSGVGSRLRPSRPHELMRARGPRSRERCQVAVVTRFLPGTGGTRH